MGKRELFKCNYCHSEHDMEEGMFLYGKYFVCDHCFEVMELLLELQYDDDTVSEEELEEYLIETDLKEKAKGLGKKGVAYKEDSSTELAPVQATVRLPVPKEIKQALDETVISQDSAKKVLAIAVYNHYLRLLNPDTQLPKSNIVLIGDSGTGKTFLVQTIAKLIDVPLIIADAPSYTQTGWKGNDVTDMLISLIMASGGDIKKAERGIVFIDEMDKLCMKHVNGTGGDINGKGVQQSLLKILDGAKITVSIQQKNYDIDTSNILFIGGGVFDGIDEEIAKRFGKVSNGIGFGATPKKDIKVDKRTVVSEDLIKHGFMPEFVGRFATIAVLEKLSAKDLVDIMTKAKNSITEQYQRLFSLSGIELSFDRKLLEEIADTALSKGTGARALKTLLEQEMKDIMFDLPGSGVNTYTMKKLKKKRGESSEVN